MEGGEGGARGKCRGGKREGIPNEIESEKRIREEV
jgi:hypothetical protein